MLEVIERLLLDGGCAVRAVRVADAGPTLA